MKNSCFGVQLLVPEDKKNEMILFEINCGFEHVATLSMFFPFVSTESLQVLISGCLDR